MSQHNDVLNDILMKDMHTPLGIMILYIKQYESIWNQHRLCFLDVCILNPFLWNLIHIFIINSTLVSLRRSGRVAICPNLLPVHEQFTPEINK